ncbi:MAG: uracil-DNA glycosylase [Pseudomonadota bacterium]
MPAPSLETEPHRDCPLCPRLAAVREGLRVEQPEWWNAPVPALGDSDAWLVIIGLAPGKHGANRTGRAFTGDASGDLLFATLAKFGLAEKGEPRGVLILNAVKCLPPGNKPVPDEIHACRPFLAAQVAASPARIVIALGRIAHQSAVKALGGRLPKCRFGHLAEHRMPSGAVLIDSYHCSRYNQNTGRLTPEMFEAVFARALAMRSA